MGLPRNRAREPWREFRTVPGKPVVKWLTHYDQYGLAFSIIVDYGGPGLPVAPRAPSRIILEQVGLHHERCASPACSLLALSGHAARAQECPLWGKADMAIALQNIRLADKSGNNRRKIEIEFTRRSRKFNYCLVLRGRQIAKA